MQSNPAEVDECYIFNYWIKRWKFLGCRSLNNAKLLCSVMIYELNILEGGRTHGVPVDPVRNLQLSSMPDLFQGPEVSLHRAALLPVTPPCTASCRVASPRSAARRSVSRQHATRISVITHQHATQQPCFPPAVKHLHKLLCALLITGQS